MLRAAAGATSGQDVVIGSGCSRGRGVLRRKMLLSRALSRKSARPAVIAAAVAYRRLRFAGPKWSLRGHRETLSDAMMKLSLNDASHCVCPVCTKQGACAPAQYKTT